VAKGSDGRCGEWEAVKELGSCERIENSRFLRL